MMFNKDHNSLIKLVEKIKYDTLIKPIFSQLNIIKDRLNRFKFIEVRNLSQKYQTFYIILFYINISFIQFLRSNNIGSKDFIKYFSTVPISSFQLIEKLKFEEGYLSLEETMSINWFKEWINSLSIDELKKFCINVTGSKEDIMVNQYLFRKLYICI